MTDVIRLEKISKTFWLGKEAVHALNNVSLQIKKGELVSIMGPSGSGKSTLLYLLGCLDKPTHGKYWLDGTEMSTLPDKELSRLRACSIGFVFQSFNLIPQLTVLENVQLPYLYHPNFLKDQRETALSALEKVGLSHRLNHRPKELSGGEMQRVAIARALACNPALILADEPTGNLDAKNAAAVLEIFTALHQSGSTIVIVTHDEKVGSFCERMVRMKHGEIAT